MIIEVEIINIKSMRLEDLIAPSLTHYFLLKISDPQSLFTPPEFGTHPLHQPISIFPLLFSDSS